jgi:glutaredoxin
MKVEKIPGKNKGEIMLYALSTCGWCRKTKDLLNSLGVEYSFVYVDQLAGEEKEEAMKEVERWNPKCSFPTLIIGGSCIVGFQDDKIKEKLKDG